jgi:hypothetical protein
VVDQVEVGETEWVVTDLGVQRRKRARSREWRSTWLIARRELRCRARGFAGCLT